MNPLHEASIILFELITGSTLHPVTVFPSHDTDEDEGCLGDRS